MKLSGVLGSGVTFRGDSLEQQTWGNNVMSSFVATDM